MFTNVLPDPFDALWSGQLRVSACIYHPNAYYSLQFLPVEVLRVVLRGSLVSEIMSGCDE
jgi:hypothetical protein